MSDKEKGKEREKELEAVRIKKASELVRTEIKQEEAFRKASTVDLRRGSVNVAGFEAEAMVSLPPVSQESTPAVEFFAQESIMGTVKRKLSLDMTEQVENAATAAARMINNDNAGESIYRKTPDEGSHYSKGKDESGHA